MVNVPDEQLNAPSIELGVYRHYKGNNYDVIGVALHSETTLPFVIYKPLYNSPSPYWIRPYDMFVSTVLIDGVEIPRFKKVS